MDSPKLGSNNNNNAANNATAENATLATATATQKYHENRAAILENFHSLQAANYKIKPKQKTPLEQFVWGIGEFLAVAYGALCGMGINASVAAAFGNPILGFAIGSVTFFINVALFRNVVPDMLVKLLKFFDLWDETVENQNDPKKRYTKLIKNEAGDKKKVGFLRGALIAFFVFIFGVGASLAYSGLLMSKFGQTIGELGALGSILSVGFPMFFFVVSVVCNWAFNTFDASEEFSKRDFFEKLYKGIKQYLLIEVDESLKTDLEIENKTNVSDGQLRLRAALRTVIFAAISFISVLAIYTVAHLGVAGLFDFIPGLLSEGQNIASAGTALQASKWGIIIAGVVGATFLYSVQITRFSSLMAKQLTTLCQHYYLAGSEGRLITTFGADLYRIAATMGNWFVKTWNFNPMEDRAHAEKYLYWVEEPGNSGKSFAEFWAQQSTMTRLTHDMQSCLSTYTQGLPLPVTALLFFPIILPSLILVGLNRFAHNAIHLLAAVNAMANGLLAIKSAPEVPADPEVPVEKVSVLDSIQQNSAPVGNAAGSAMCYANKLAQDAEKEKGNTGLTQSTYTLCRTLFNRQKPTKDFELVDLYGKTAKADKDSAIINDPDDSLRKELCPS